MRMYDLIVKKREQGELSSDEIHFMIEGYVLGTIPDYQMSAMLMAIFLRGMTDQETAALTLAMAHSGKMIDLSPIKGVKVDKHSTGGVGDKTTFIVGPVVAACGGKVAKMSGRGLGHTGGTVDKMESIPGIRSSLEEKDFFRIVNEVGVSVIGQSDELAPADKKLYALRDVTGTVESIPLIASSIMSKKLAAGSDAILLDVKVGSGAFMKTLDEAILLAEKMVAIGEYNGRRTTALITDMDRPLGQAIGNSLEIREVIAALQGKGPADLTAEGAEIAGHMLYLCGLGSLEECRQKALTSIRDGSGLARLQAMIEAQGGDGRVIEEPNRLGQAQYEHRLLADQEGYLTHMDAEKCGLAAVLLGAGRAVKDEKIDLTAGIIMKKKTGDQVQRGDVLAVFYTDREKTLPEAEALYRSALTFGAEAPPAEPLVYAQVTKSGVTREV